MTHRLAAALLGSISLTALVAPAFAAGSIETVVVTAQKREEALKDVPMSVTVLSGDKLERLQASSFEDYVTTVPGLNYTAAEPGHTQLILRGINAGGVGSTIGTYVDETPYGSSSALANGTITTPNLDTFDIARVEILRGPQGTLYGSSTLGGLLKIVTNAPTTDEFSAKMEVGGSDRDYGGTGWLARGMANVPLGDEAAFRLVAYHETRSGYIDDPGRNLTNVNGVHDTGGRASFLYKPTEELTIRLSAVLQELHVGNDQAEDVDIVGGRIVPLFGKYQQKREFGDPGYSHYQVFNGTTEYDFGWANLMSSTSYDTFHDAVITDATGVFGPTLGVQGFLSQKKFTEEVRLASPSRQTFEWLVGGYYTHERAMLHQDIASFPTRTVLGSLDLNSKYVEEAAFANLTYHFTDWFDLGVGGRYSHNSQSALEFGLASAQGDSTGNVFTWSVAPSFHLDDQTTIYARVAKGFRPGGPNALPLPIPAGVPKFYAADSLINYEAGVKSVLLDGRLSLDADVFLIDWSDIQLLVVSNNIAVNANGGTARSQGFEWSIGWQPVERLSLSFAGAYTDAHLTADTDPNLVGALSGDPLPWSPRWSTVLDGDYEFDAMGDFTPFVGATWRYVGRRHTDFSPATGQFGTAAYNQVDARVGVDWKDWTVEFYGRNLTDARGYTAFGGSGTSAASGNAATAGVMAPREVGILLRAKF